MLIHMQASQVATMRRTLPQSSLTLNERTRDMKEQQKGNGREQLRRVQQYHHLMLVTCSSVIL